MSTKNLTIFETTYEKVLSILNKVKDFIIKNTKDYENIIEDLNWIQKVITNKTLDSYEVKRDKLSPDNPSHQKFLDFITKYNEEIINLNKKHVVVRDILSISKIKEILQKPSLILKKIPSKELNEETFNEIDKQNKNPNSLGKWVMNIIIKNQEENADSQIKNNNSYKNIKNSNKSNTKNEKNLSHNKISSGIKNKNFNHLKSVKNINSSITPINKYKHYISGPIKFNLREKIKDHENNISNIKKNNLTLSEIKKGLENYYLHTTEGKNKYDNIKKKILFNKEPKIKNNNTNISKKKATPIDLNTLIEEHFEFMKNITEQDFNIFKLKKLVGYSNVLPLMCHFIFKILGLIDTKIIYVKKFNHFLTAISQGYLETTLYHNALHGADVCHSLFLYITNSNIEEICQTSILDLLGLVVSATGHDLGHPGYNNNFHVNSSSELALTYNDISCLENFHTSTLFKILRKEENNIFEYMEDNNYKQIRKRIVKQILATDMINHAMVLSCVKAKISDLETNNNLDENKNRNFQFLSGNEKTKFDEQQMMLNYLIHTADLGHNTKKFEISIQWVELLTKEFWNQGDIEKEKNLSVSFLCDRNDVDVPQSQVGFLKAFIFTTFDILVQMFPSLQFTLDNANNNLKEWQNLLDQKRKRGWTPNKKDKDKDKEEKN